MLVKIERVRVTPIALRDASLSRARSGRFQGASTLHVLLAGCHELSPSIESRSRNDARQMRKYDPARTIHKPRF